MKFLGSLVAAFSVAATAIAVVPTSSAHADEYFIPKGHVYSPGTNYLAPKFSRRAEIEARTDIIETEIYRKKEADREFYERLRMFNDLDLMDPGRSYSHY